MRSRRTQKKAIADEIQSSYANNTSLVVHWDGKLLPDDGKKKVDRLPDIVTDPWRTTKLVGTTKLPARTGQAIANAITECLEDWQSGNCQIIWLDWTLICSVTPDQHWCMCSFVAKTGTPTFSFGMPPSHSGASGRGSIHYELRPIFWSWNSQIKAFPIKLEYHWQKQVWAIDAWWSGLWAGQCFSQLQGTGCAILRPEPRMSPTSRWLPRTSSVGHHCFWWLSSKRILI